jgi:hypothetical protein
MNHFKIIISSTDYLILLRYTLTYFKYSTYSATLMQVYSIVKQEKGPLSGSPKSAEFSSLSVKISHESFLWAIFHNYIHNFQTNHNSR